MTMYKENCTRESVYRGIVSDRDTGDSTNPCLIQMAKRETLED